MSSQIQKSPPPGQRQTVGWTDPDFDYEGYAPATALKPLQRLRSRSGLDLAMPSKSSGHTQRPLPRFTAKHHTSCARISSKAAIETHQTPVRSHGRPTTAMAA